MRILVGSAFEALSGWAHAINTVKMAEGFARLGHQVSIVCKQSPHGKATKAQLAETYGLSGDIRWIHLPQRCFRMSIDQHWSFGLPALLPTLIIRPDLVFSRNYIFPWLTSLLGFPTVAESHTPGTNNTPAFLRFVSGTRRNSFRTWVTISEVLAEQYRSLGVPPEKITVLPDAVDFNLFHPPSTMPASPYGGNKPNAVYAGHVFEPYKGIDTILQAALQLPDVNFQLLGGLQEQLIAYRAQAKELGLENVFFLGLKNHSDVPLYLWHADVLLMPLSQHHPSAAWTSPVKLGEYLASGKPVVATTVPALQKWLSEKEVLFVEPDNAEALAGGIRSVLGDVERARSLTRNGVAKAQTLSYEKRAEHILSKCKK